MRSLAQLLSTGLFLAFCQTAFAQDAEIAVTFVPAQGSTTNLQGTVSNVDFDDFAVAVYIYVNGWWNKPTNATPLTPLSSSGNWSCDITTGGADAYATRIAAFLLPHDYAPPLLNGAANLPPELEAAAIDQVVSIRKSPNAFHFSGYDWDVKTTGDFVFGPGPNVFSDRPENVWVDSEGKLHLRITHENGQWRCAEVISDQSFGYGTYRFYIDSIVDDLDENVVLGLFTWSDDPAFSHREIDIEISRWQNAADPANAQFVIQPYDTSGNLQRWTIPTGTTPSTHSFSWEFDQIDFVSHGGAYNPIAPISPILSAWTYQGSDIPIPGGEQIRLNLWLVNGQPPVDGEEVEVVISRFVFVPQNIPPPELIGISLNTFGEIEMDLLGIPQLHYRVDTSSDLITWITTDSVIAPESDFTMTLIPKNLESDKKFIRVEAPAQ